MSLTDAIDNIIKDVAELPDRNSPEGWPEAMIVTGDELRMFIERHIAAGQTPKPAELAAEYCRGRDDGWEAAKQKYRQPPKPAGAVPLPEPEWLTLLRKELFLAAMKSNFTLTRDELQHLINLGDAREAAGRAAAVPTWFGELPAHISNPEAWPANYASGYNDALTTCYDVIRGNIPQQPEAEGDDIAVDRFAEAMKAKMAAARAKGRGGWEGPTCNAQMLSDMLRNHVEKGDPRDVANFCMMLWNRGEAIQAAEGETRDEKIARVQTSLREQAKRFRDPIELAQEIHGTAPRDTVGDVESLASALATAHTQWGAKSSETRGSLYAHMAKTIFDRIERANFREAALAGGEAYTVECVHTTTQEGTCFFEVKTDDPPESGAKLYTRPTPAADAGGVPDAYEELLAADVEYDEAVERHIKTFDCDHFDPEVGNARQAVASAKKRRAAAIAALTPEVRHGE